MKKPLKATVEQYVSSSPEETAELASRLAADLAPGSVVALSGPLGSGKTVFVKGIAKALGVSPSETTSPTFTIINEYAGSLPLYHIDLYRLEEFSEVLELGLDEYFDGGGIVAVEWPERARLLLPVETIVVAFERLSEKARTIRIGRLGEE